MNKAKGFISITLAIVISVIAIALAGVGVYYKLESDKQAEETNTNPAVNNNTSSQCIDFTMPEICTTLYVPGYYYDKNADGCIFDGNGCTKPYATLKECTAACASVSVTENDTAPIKQTCGNVIVYNVSNDDVSAARQDCQTRGGTFKECDSPCGSALTVCQMSCTLLAANNSTINQNTNTLMDIVTIEPSDEWKTYTNAELGYSIQYPANWFLVKDTNQAYEAVDDQIIIYNFDPENAPGRELASNEVKLVLAAHENPGNLTAKQYVESLKQNPSFSFGDIIKENETSVAGIASYYVESEGLGTAYQTYLKGSRYLYSFVGYSEYEMYTRILNTFKLI